MLKAGQRFLRLNNYNYVVEVVKIIEGTNGFNDGKEYISCEICYLNKSNNVEECIPVRDNENFWCKLLPNQDKVC